MCQEEGLLFLVKTGLSRTTVGLAPIYELANSCMWDWLHLLHHTLIPARYMHPWTPHIVITTSNCVAYGAHFYNLNVLHCTFAAMVAEHFVGRNAANTEHMRAPLLLFKGLDAILEEHTTFYGDEGWPASCQSLSTHGILTGMGVLTIVYQASNICATLHGLSFLFTICLSSHPRYQRIHQVQEVYGKNHLNLPMTTATLRIGPECSMICAAQKITVAAGLRKYYAELKLGHGIRYRGFSKTKQNTSRLNVEWNQCASVRCIRLILHPSAWNYLMYRSWRMSKPRTTISMIIHMFHCYLGRGLRRQTLLRRRSSLEVNADLILVVSLQALYLQVI